MTRRVFGLATPAAVAAVGLAFAADPTAPPPGAAARGEALEFVVTAADKPARVRLSVEADGKPLSAVWDETFAKLFAFFDRNADGAIDDNEVAHLPPPLALRLALGNGFTPPVGPPPAFRDIDADADGKVSPAELNAYYRRAGLGNALVGVGRLPSGAVLTDAILKYVDADGDGKLTETEWKAAAESLRKLDANDDELVGAGELAPKTVYPGAAGTTMLTPRTVDGTLPDVLAKLPLVRLPTDDAGKGPAELAAWRKLDPAATWTVKVGGSSADRFALAGTVRVEGWATAGRMPKASAAARKQLTAQFGSKADDTGMELTRPRRSGVSWLTPVADRDGDGKLSPAEFGAWLALQEQIAKGLVLVTVLDGDPALFELLDANHDGALSVRELRGAWDRVRDAGAVTGGVFDLSKLPRVLLAAVSHGYPKSFGTDLRGGPPWFRAMDRNGDGDVSRREFTGPKEVFDRLDADGDGLLSPAEAERAAPPK